MLSLPQAAMGLRGSSPCHSPVPMGSMMGMAGGATVGGVGVRRDQGITGDPFDFTVLLRCPRAVLAYNLAIFLS